MLGCRWHVGETIARYGYPCIIKRCYTHISLYADSEFMIVLSTDPNWLRERLMDVRWSLFD